MVGTPRFYTTLWTLETFWEAVYALEAELAWHNALVLGENLCAELLFEVFADYPYNLAKSGSGTILAPI